MFGVRTVTSFITGEPREQASGQCCLSVRGIHVKLYKEQNKTLLHDNEEFSDNSSWMLGLTTLISEFCFTESTDGDHFH